MKKKNTKIIWGSFLQGLLYSSGLKKSDSKNLKFFSVFLQ